MGIITSNDPPQENWVKDPRGNSHEAWIDVIYQHYPDGKHWYKAGVKFDGCVHLFRAYNCPFPQHTNEDDEENHDYIHICSIDEMIK